MAGLTKSHKINKQQYQLWTVIMCITENLTLSQNKYEIKSVVGINLQSLKCHKDEVVVLPKTLQEQPDILALTKLWLAENDNLHEYECKIIRQLSHAIGKMQTSF